jgi:hypothetical protein
MMQFSRLLRRCWDCSGAKRGSGGTRRGHRWRHVPFTSGILAELYDTG